jgi:flagellar biosynthetic protein FliR
VSIFINVVVFWLLASRLTGFLILAPGLPDMQVPKLVRVALVVWLTCFMAPLVAPPADTSLALGHLAGALVMEFMFGLGLGLVTRMVLAAVQVGGALMDNDLGLSAAQQINPAAGISGGVMNRFLLLAGLAFFWMSDYFSTLIVGFQQSFRVLPLGGPAITTASIDLIARTGGDLFAAGLMLAAPIAVLTFIVTMALGFLSRSVQHLNIFAESFTLRVAVGGAGVVFLLPLLLFLSRFALERMLPAAADYIKAMS